MAGKKTRQGTAQDRTGGIAKAVEAARRGASERAAERAAGQAEPAQRAESPQRPAPGAAGGETGGNARRPRGQPD